MKISSQTRVCEQTPHKLRQGSSLVVQWLRPCDSTARGVGLIPGQVTKILHASWCGQKIQKNKQQQKQQAGFGPGPKVCRPLP